MVTNLRTNWLRKQHVVNTQKLHFAESKSARWQKEWEICNKAATTKQYFPTVQERLTTKKRVTQNIAAKLTGHGKTRVYFHRFNILETATSACGQGDQTIDHLLYHCTLLETKRQTMKKNGINAGHWPASKQDLITKHRDFF